MATAVSDQATLESITPRKAFPNAPTETIKEIEQLVSYLNDPEIRRIVSKVSKDRRSLKEAVMEWARGDLLEAGGTISFKDAGEISISHTKYAPRAAQPERTATRIGVKGYKATQSPIEE